MSVRGFQTKRVHAAICSAWNLYISTVAGPGAQNNVPNYSKRDVRGQRGTMVVRDDRETVVPDVKNSLGRVNTRLPDGLGSWISTTRCRLAKQQTAQNGKDKITSGAAGAVR